MGYRILEVLHGSTGRALVQGYRRLVIRNVCEEGINVLKTKSLNEMLARHAAVNWNMVMVITRDIATAATNRSPFLNVHWSQTCVPTCWSQSRRVVVRIRQGWRL